MVKPGKFVYMCFLRLGIPFWGSHDKCYGMILGSILGYPDLGKLPYYDLYKPPYPKRGFDLPLHGGL